MRGASPVDHNLGGVHISGAECITHESMIKEEALNLIHRALNHPKGKSDFINISIQKILGCIWKVKSAQRSIICYSNIR